MSNAFSIALSSLQAESQAIATAGQNLANINTTGYKGSNVEFRDLVASNLTVSSGHQFGMGVTQPIAQQIFSQGTITSNTSPWAAAIQGNGFFALKGAGDQSLYTRDGNFTVNANGLLSTLSGERVQGWVSGASGTLNTGATPTDIVIPTGQNLPAKATTNLSFTANLNAAGTTAGGSDKLSVAVPTVDSLGYSHNLTVTFTKSSTANTWSYDVTIPSEDLAGGTAGTTTSILSSPGTISFNSDGSLTTASSAPIALGINNLADGAANMSMNWSMLNSDGTGTITQFAQASAYDNVSQDGNPAGQLTNVGIGDGGQILATFSNGLQKVFGQLAMATFRNTDSLNDVGNNNFATSGKTAPVSLGVPQTGGRGEIISGALEGSNVDIATQFTNLITFQRGYQASSRVITTEDNMLQDLLQIIR